jgi:hypothetical protein
MARQTLAEWKIYTDGLFVTGNIGGISAATMRNYSDQQAANNRPVFAAFNTSANNVLNLTTTPTKYVFFDEEQIVPSDDSEIDPDLVTNVFNYPLGWVYKTSASLIIDGSNGAGIVAQFYRDNGTGFEPEGDIAAGTMRGNGNPVAITIPAFPFIMNTASTIELRIWTTSGNTTINVLNTDKTSWMITELVPWAM